MNYPHVDVIASRQDLYFRRIESRGQLSPPPLRRIIVRSSLLDQRPKDSAHARLDPGEPLQFLLTVQKLLVDRLADARSNGHLVGHARDVTEYPKCSKRRLISPGGVVYSSSPLAYNESELRGGILDLFYEGQGLAANGALDTFRGICVHQGRRKWTRTEKPPEKIRKIKAVREKAPRRAHVGPYCVYCGSKAPDHRCAGAPIVFAPIWRKVSHARYVKPVVRATYAPYRACRLCGASAKGHNCPAEKSVCANS